MPDINDNNRRKKIRVSTRNSIDSQTTPSNKGRSKLKSSKKNRKEKIKYKSAIDYLRKKRPSRNESRNRSNDVTQEEIEYDDDMWIVQVPRKFPYLRDS